mgnify:CR=1 FL=1
MGDQLADFKIPKFDAEVLISGDDFGTRDYKPYEDHPGQLLVFRYCFTKHHDDDEQVYYFLYDQSKGLSSLLAENDVWVSSCLK